MPTDLDASPDAAATSFAHPQETFDASLTRAAQRLMDLGGVSDVRVLHNGRVITGIAGDRQRVYVQYSHADATILDGECSCGELSPCVHIAAVVMSAATLASERSTDNRPRDAGTVPRPSDGAVHGRESLRQFLAYLIEPDAEGFRLSVWVAQSVAGSAGIEPGAHPFAARTADGGKNYPRYVDSRDRAILDILPSRLDSPWQFTGAHGFEVLQRLLETQRAFWRTLPVDTPPQGPAMSEGTAPPRLAARTTSEHRQSPRGTPAQHRQPPRGAPMPNRRALRAGAARPAHFAWRILANGDQCLTGEPHGDAAATPSDSGLDAGSFEWLLHVDPPVYIDTSTGLCGPLDLPYPAEVLRHYWRRATIDPAEVAAILAELADDSRATRFPRPHRLAVEPRALSSVRARLVLSAGPSVRVQFLYNDMLVASAPPQHAEQISRQFVEPDLPQAGGQPSQQLAEPLSPPPAVHDSAPPTAHASPPPAAHASPPPAAHASPPLAARASISRSGDARTEAVVRHRDGNTVHEIKRDAELERQLRAQLDECLPDTPREAGAWLTFMMHGVPALQALGWQIAVQPDFPYRIATAEEWYVDVQSHRATPANEPGMAPATARARTPHGTSDTREWFDLRLGVRVDGHCVNLLPALVDYLQGASGGAVIGQHDALNLLAGEHLLVSLEDGRFLPVPLARIQRIADTLVELYDQQGSNEWQALTLPAAQAGRLAQFALGPDAPVLRANESALLAAVNALDGFSSIEPMGAPAQCRTTLRRYQQEGLGWLQFLRRQHFGGILADDMGLGKTVQTLAHLAVEKQEGRMLKPSLIVAPVSVIGNWQQEMQRLVPELAFITYHGAKRKQLFPDIRCADIVIIGYPLMLLDSALLLEHDFYFVILDEAQNIKNPQAKVSQVARALRADHRLCLTGTPLENHLGELWSLFDFVHPGLLGERQQFQRLYRTPIENGGDIRRAAALARRIQPFLLRRTKDAVARDLPPKIQIVEPIQLDERQRDFYDGIRLGQHRRVREAIEQRGLARSRITVLDALLKLRQACCDPRLVAGPGPGIQTGAHADGHAGTDTGALATHPHPSATQGGTDEPIVPVARRTRHAPLPRIPSAKLNWLAATLPELIAEGRRILLFSQFTSMLRLIEAVVNELAIPYCMLTGDTRERSELVERFQAGGVPVFLISLRAGGTGLNLTAADTIIHYDPWWNPAVEAQATDRAHRIGQDKPVFVYKLIAQGTVEEKIMQLQADKHALVTQLYTDQNASPSQWTPRDLESLFAP